MTKKDLKLLRDIAETTRIYIMELRADGDKLMVDLVQGERDRLIELIERLE